VETQCLQTRECQRCKSQAQRIQLSNTGKCYLYEQRR